MDLATLQTRIGETENAIHALMTGTREVEIRFGDRMVRYTEANLADLQRYHSWLQQQLEVTVNGKRRPIYIID